MCYCVINCHAVFTPPHNAPAARRSPTLGSESATCRRCVDSFFGV